MLTQLAFDSLVLADPVEPDHRGVADVVQDVRTDLHRLWAEGKNIGVKKVSRQSRRVNSLFNFGVRVLLRVGAHLPRAAGGDVGRHEGALVLAGGGGAFGGDGHPAASFKI